MSNYNRIIRIVKLNCLENNASPGIAIIICNLYGMCCSQQTDRQTARQADEGVRRVSFVSRLNINSPFVVLAAAAAPAKNMQICSTPTRYSSTYDVVVVCRVCDVM